MMTDLTFTIAYEKASPQEIECCDLREIPCLCAYFHGIDCFRVLVECDIKYAPMVKKALAHYE